MWRIAVFLTLVSCVFAQKAAIVYLSDPSGTYNATGNVTFTKDSDGLIRITGVVSGLETGNHGFHIHSLGDVTGGCGSTGSHFNPHNVTHGGPNDTVRHVGDLGNIEADADGLATIDFTDSIIDLEGEHGIIGRALVVHVGEDDLGKGEDDSLITGNAGGRLACGVIGILDDTDSSSVVFSANYAMMLIASIATCGFKILF